MSKFIEVHIGTKPTLINLDWVEEIHKEATNRAMIYFAFSVPDGTEQDWTLTDESYDEICDLIWRKGC